MPPRIVQTGTYCSANKGDAAMQLACAAGIGDRWPHARIQISAPFPDMDAPFYSGIAEVIPCARRRIMHSLLQMVRSAAWGLIHKLTGRNTTWLIADPELLAYHQADLVIDLSGDMLTEDYGVHVAISHYIPLVNILLLGRPLYICAQSIGPFKWTKLMARWIFKRAIAITLREQSSFQHLASLRADTVPARLTADLAFLLSATSPDRVDEILASEKIDFSECPLIGVSVSTILEREYGSSRNPARPSFVQMMAEALDEFCASHNTALLFVPHVNGPTHAKDDRQISRRVAEAMRLPAFTLNNEYRPQELKGIIAHCSMFVGARMHANIAALSSGVPVLALSYSHKALGIMKMLGQEEWTVSGDQLTGPILIDMMAGLWEKRRAVASGLHERNPEIQQRARENFETLGRFIP